MENFDPTEPLKLRFGEISFTKQATKDEILTLWVPLERVIEVLKYLKTEITHPFPFLFDLTAIDERSRKKDPDYPSTNFTLVYHLFSFSSNSFIRIKVALAGEYPTVPSATSIWSNVNWYEREVYDMFGIRFTGHPHLTRILMPLTWEGHPLRKEHPARATEMGPFRLWDEKQDREQSALQFRPEEWGMELQSEDSDFMFLNIGPQHPGTHGVLRIILQLDGEDIVQAVPDIGFHHRGAEKMAERDHGTHTYLTLIESIIWVALITISLTYCRSKIWQALPCPIGRKSFA